MLSGASVGRWVVLLAVSLLLHLTVLEWTGDRIGFLSQNDDRPVAVAMQLVVPPPPPPPPPRKAKRKPKPKRQPKPVAKPKRQPPPVRSEAVARPAALADAIPSVPAMPAADIIAAAMGNARDAPAAPDPEVVAENAKADEPEAIRYAVNPPPSAELTYDVSAVRDHENWYGTGVFRWESAKGRYSIAGEASIRIIFKIGLLNFKSEGTINDFGIAPLLYTEQSRNKPLTSTEFRHAQQKILFSASPATYPYHGGEQDRASVMWQLASIGRGDPGQFRAGAGFDIVVAGTRDADAWRITVLGEEEIETGYGNFATWHVVRLPNAESRDQQIDIWLAKQHEWYPVKVRYTEPNGDHLDMSLSDLERISPTESSEPTEAAGHTEEVKTMTATLTPTENP